MHYEEVVLSFKERKWSHSVVSDSLWPHRLVAYPDPPSMGFSRQEYWSGLPFPSPEDLPDLGIKPGSPALQADALPSEPPGNYALFDETRRLISVWPIWENPEESAKQCNYCAPALLRSQCAQWSPKGLVKMQLHCQWVWAGGWQALMWCSMLLIHGPHFE